jgi:hypothetical protein
MGPLSENRKAERGGFEPRKHHTTSITWQGFGPYSLSEMGMNGHRLVSFLVNAVTERSSSVHLGQKGKGGSPFFFRYLTIAA